jgi:hypothetical protein
MGIDEETYIRERLDDQIDWYSKKSSSNKKLHYFFRIVELLITAVIAIMALLECFYFKFIIGALGISLTSLYSIHIFCKLQENWIEYRKTSEILKHEKYMFLARSGVYNNPDISSDIPFKILVERCETVISHENINWAQLNSNEYLEKK